MTTPLARFADALRRDLVGGLLLIAAAAIGLLWINSPWSSSYIGIRDAVIGPESLHLALTVSAWASDGLLVLFFFLVGAELKQEFVHGPLRDPRTAVVPVVAAVCGALVPAAIFIAVTAGTSAAQGWGIPMATDVAFALAVLAIVGRGLPGAVRMFLLTLAVVDDLIAIVVIAVFYSSGIAPAPLAIAVGLVAVFALLQRSRLLDRSTTLRIAVYAPLAVAIWAATHAAGIHATIAGVAMGLAMRTTVRSGENLDPAHRAERFFRPWVMGLALPVFALFAAGVPITAGAAGTVTVAVAAGLVVGKLVGVTGGAWLATTAFRARLDPSLTWWNVIGISQLAGIGFTVSLLIAELSYPTGASLLDEAKTGVLAGSLVAVALAVVTLRLRRGPSGDTTDAQPTGMSADAR